ncbi:unnamed protein product [Meganyctiphanes norvegica]|uniref:Uncharacterized protein n=1 Tax=Meganyctiphanes norvegica TaxID=48144 RepID=A0AAV2Q3B5_MEGNR
MNIKHVCNNIIFKCSVQHLPPVDFDHYIYFVVAQGDPIISSVIDKTKCKADDDENSFIYLLIDEKRFGRKINEILPFFCNFMKLLWFSGSFIEFHDISWNP